MPLSERFYGPEQATIHHERFGDLAAEAATRLLAELRAAGLTRGTIVDLGCGSGILAAHLCDAGYQVVGIDMSPAMIELARAAAPRAIFITASIFDAPIPTAVAVTAVGEPLNYAMAGPAALDDFARFTQRVHDALVPSGVFLFDVSITGRYGPTGRTAQFHDAPTWSLGMHGTEADGMLVREIAVFHREADDRYRRVNERHVLRLADPDEVHDTLEATGFAVETFTRYNDTATQSTPAAGFAVFLARRTPDPRPSAAMAGSVGS
jgi:SAM-dependent methyltransferase